MDATGKPLTLSSIIVAYVPHRCQGDQSFTKRVLFLAETGRHLLSSHFLVEKLALQCGAVNL